MRQRKKIDQFLDSIGLQITSVKIRRRRRVGVMPENTRERFEVRFGLIKRKLSELEKLAVYADQMSTELRHLLADEAQELHVRSERLARALLGGDRDLRKIQRPLCDVEIPLRKVEETPNAQDHS